MSDAGAISAPPPRDADTFVRLGSDRVQLRPLLPGDYDVLYALATRPEVVVQWRHRGTFPPPEQFGSIIWQGVLTQLSVVVRGQLEPVGLVQAYGADLRNGFASLALLIEPELHKTGIGIEAAAYFVDHLFKCWTLRKIYLESLEPSAGAFWSALSTFLRLEGCFLDHEYLNNKYWNMYVFALYRETWERESHRLITLPEG